MTDTLDFHSPPNLNHTAAVALALEFQSEATRIRDVPPPMVKCGVCTYQDDEADCPLDTVVFFDACGHSVCYDCLKGVARADFEGEGKIPRCPALVDDARCTHVLTEQEMAQV